MNDDFVPQWIIERKRDGGALADAEIREWIARFADGRLPDYQMAAMAMAIYFKGMTPAEIGLLQVHLARRKREAEAAEREAEAAEREAEAAERREDQP